MAKKKTNEVDTLPQVTALVNVDAPNSNPFQTILGLPLIERTLHALDRSQVPNIVLFAPQSGEQLTRLVQKNKKWKAQISILSAINEAAAVKLMQEEAGVDRLIITEPLVVEPNYIQELIEQGRGETALKNAANSLAFIPNSIRLTEAQGFTDLLQQLEAAKLFMPSSDKLYCEKVHDNNDLKAIKRTLMQSLIKPTDGWVSRNINRKISTLFSRALANTPITPNQISVGTMLIGLITGYYLAQGGYFYFLVGATMFQATSVLDGVDGELARLRFQQSDFGQWLDTIADNLTYVAALVGIIIGVYTNDSPQYIIWAGYIGLGMVFLTLASQYLYLVRFDSGGSLLNIPYNFKKGETTFDKIMQYAEIFGRRDFFAFVFFIFGLLGIMPFSLVYVSLMVTIVFGFSLQAHFTASKQR